MSKPIKETVTLSITVELLEMPMMDGETLYLASIPNVACGSGTSPDKAYEGLAHVLTYGDDDVDPSGTLPFWQQIIDRARQQSKPAQEPQPSLFGEA